TLAPDVTKENVAMFKSATGQPAEAPANAKPTGVNEPPRSDQPSDAPVQTGDAGGTGVGVEVVHAPNGTPANDPNALVKPIAPETSQIPAAEAPAKAPDQTNDIKPGQEQQAPATAENGKPKKPKADLSSESDSKKKKKKGLGKLNPF
ncbi:MAG TPA: hypothetical protein VGJ21_16010, partial [Terracidiphilus sp.]